MYTEHILDGSTWEHDSFEMTFLYIPFEVEANVATEDVSRKFVMQLHSYAAHSCPGAWLKVM